MDKFIIQHPIITEKGTSMNAFRTYLFLVEKRATKPEIQKAIKGIYNVDPIKVRIINTRPKPRRLGQREGTIPGYKKAMVTLKEGQKLDILPH